jgi:hypothetical protein
LIKASLVAIEWYSSGYSVARGPAFVSPLFGKKLATGA